MTMAHKTILYAADVSVLSDNELFYAAYESTSEERKTKTDRFRFDKDKRLSIGAELLLKKALREFKIDADDLSLRFGETGKPYLNGRNDVFFNISHSDNYALCAVSDHEIGCDIEKVSDINLNVAKRFFFRSEYDRIASEATKDLQNDLFFRYWTLKESFMKVTGLGMKLPLDAFEIVLNDGGIYVVQSVDERIYSFKEYGEISGYKCAVCIADKSCDAALELIDIAN